MTVTAAEDSDYTRDEAYHIADKKKNITCGMILENLLNTVITVVIDKKTGCLGTIASICGLNFADFIYTDERAFDSLALNGATSWTRVFIEVYANSKQAWQSFCYVESATMVSHFSGSYYSRTLGRNTAIQPYEVIETLDSPHYNDEQWANEKAIQKYLQGEYGSFYHDKTGYVKYYFGGEAVIIHPDDF